MKRRVQKRNFVLMAPAKFWDRPLALFLLGSLCVALLIISTLKPSLFSTARTHAVDASAPLLSFVGTPVQNFVASIREASGLSDLQAENEALKQENKRLREWYQTALTLSSENKSLKSLLNVKLDPPRRYISARTLLDNSSGYVKSIVIKVGQNDGVQKNDAVLSGNGLIGRIVEVGKTTARVLLLNDINSRIPVQVQNTGQHAILAGQNARQGVLEHVPDDALIGQGVRIVTSGVGGVFPAGLPIGKVSGMKNEHPQVTFFSNANTLDYVRVVSEARDPNLTSAGQ